MSYTAPSRAALYCATKAAIACIMRPFITGRPQEMSKKNSKPHPAEPERFDQEFTAKLRRYLDLNQFEIVDRRDWEKWQIIRQTVLGKVKY